MSTVVVVCVVVVTRFHVPDAVPGDTATVVRTGAAILVETLATVADAVTWA